MKIMLHAVDCATAPDFKEWYTTYQGIGEEGYNRVMAMIKAFPQALIENYAGTTGCRNKEIHFEYFAEEKELDFQWEMTEEEFNRLMHPHDTSNNYCGAVHFGNCKLEFVFEHVHGDNYVSFNNLYIYGNEDGYAKLDDGTPYSYEDDMFCLPTVDDFGKWKAECERRIIHSLNYDQNMWLPYALERTKVKEWYPHGKWYMTIEEAAGMVARELLADRTKTFAFCESDAEEAKGNPYRHVDNGGWYGIKRIDGFFDNEPSELIVAVGHYGGGHCAFGYVDIDCEDATKDEIKLEVMKAIATAIDLSPSDYIFIEEDEKKEEK